MQPFRRFTLGIIFFLNILLIFLLLFEDQVHLPAFLQVGGRMHPLVLHFPLALLFVGIVLECLKAQETFANPSTHRIAAGIFYLYALSATITAVFGFFLYKEGTYLGEDVAWHKWLGIAVSLLALPLVVLSETTFRALFYATLGLTAICLVIAGHLGAEVTHGSGFLTEPLRKQSPPFSTVEDPDSAVIFRDVIQPILNEKCISCHNSNRAKGDLILSDYKGIIEGGEEPNGIVKGDAGKSLLYKYITLPMEDTLHMPPKDKLQLDREEIRLIGWWINTGAQEDTKYAGLPKVDSIHPLMAARFHPRTGLDLLDISFADFDDIMQLNNPYRTVQQISSTKPYIAVFLGSKTDFSPKDLTELGKVNRQVVSIDLGNSAVTDDDLKNVGQFTHLQKLYLQNSAVSDAGIKQLHGLRFLEVLNLSGTGITANTLKEVSGWPNLKKLYVYNTPISEESVLTFRKSHDSPEVFNTQIDLSDSIYSATLTAPVVKIDSFFFHKRALVEVKLSRGKVNYYYTTDGSIPTSASPLYTQPFEVNHSAEIRMKATMTGWADSEVVMFPLMKLGARLPPARMETNPDTQRGTNADSVLVDGRSGGLNSKDKEYLRFVDEDLQVFFALPAPTKVSRLSMSLLEDVSDGVFLPEHIEVWGGDDIDKLSKIASHDPAMPVKDSPPARRIISLAFQPHTVRFVRLKAVRLKRLPTWHDNRKRAAASLVVDEISIE